MTALLLALTVVASAAPAPPTEAGAAPAAPPPPILLAANREAQCRIVLALQPTAGERSAAGVLQDYLQRMTRAEVPVLTAQQAGHGVRLLVGSAAAVVLGADLSRRNLGPEGFVLRSVGQDAIAIAGANDDSTLTAVYAFLEHLGCRWYMPGEIGEVVPRKPELLCPVVNRTEVPSFYHRVLWYNGNVTPTLTAQSQQEYAEWCRRNRLGGLPAGHGHAFDRIVPEDRYFAAHPEYFSLVRDQNGATHRERGRQLCTSNPDVIALAAQAANDYFAANPTALCFSLSPNDNAGFCECDACRALDGPGPNGLSDRLLTFVNAVAEKTDQVHPGKLLAYYALYSNLPGPPTRVRPRANVMPVMVDTACHLHALADETCSTNGHWRGDVHRWRGLAPQLFAYDYFQYSDLPTPVNRIVGPNLRHYRDLGCLGVSGEILGRSQANNVALYLAARMLWNADQDPDALLEEFYEGYYGYRVAPAMRRYYETLEAAAREQKLHVIGSTPSMYTPTLLADLRACLAAAEQQAHGRVLRRRVEMALLDLQATALYAQAVQAREAWAADRSPAKQQAALDAIGAAEEFLKSIADQDIVAEGILLAHLADLRAGLAAPRS